MSTEEEGKKRRWRCQPGKHEDRAELDHFIQSFLLLHEKLRYLDRLRLSEGQVTIWAKLGL